MCHPTYSKPVLVLSNILKSMTKGKTREAERLVHTSQRPNESAMKVKHSCDNNYMNATRDELRSPTYHLVWPLIWFLRASAEMRTKNEISSLLCVRACMCLANPEMNTPVKDFKFQNT